MDPPDLSAWLIVACVLIMLATTWAVDVLGSRSARHSVSWKHSDSMYHDDVGGWRCCEDQWLWPAAFGPDKRIIRYEGAHTICGHCPFKDSYSPTPGPREITRSVDPWPYSDAGRFHRDVGLVIACVDVFIPVLLMVISHAINDFIVLGTTTVVIIVAGILSLARHPWSIPDNALAHLPHVGLQEHRKAEEARHSSGTGPASASVSARPSGYHSMHEVAEAITTAQACAAAAGRTMHVSFLADSDDAAKANGGTAVSIASVEPKLRRVTVIYIRKRVLTIDARLGSSGTHGGARRSWSSAWNRATDTTHR